MKPIIRILLNLLAGSFLFAPLSLLAQPGSGTVSLGSGWSYSKILDEYLSPMHYKGGGYLFKVGLDNFNDRIYNHLEFIYQKNNIEPDLDNSSSAILYRGNMDWVRAWKLKSGDGLNLFFGGHVLAAYESMHHQVWYNNSYSYNLVFNAGPSVVATLTPFQASPEILIAWEISVPFLNYIIRPSYGTLLPEGAVSKREENNWTYITGGRITSLHEYQRIISNIYLSSCLTKRMNARLGYQWDFQNYSVNNHYQSANHLIYIGIYYQIKK